MPPSDYESFGAGFQAKFQGEAILHLCEYVKSMIPPKLACGVFCSDADGNLSSGHSAEGKKWRQVDLLDRSATVGESKTEGGKGRVIPLNQDAYEAVMKWHSNFEDPLRRITCSLLNGMVSMDTTATKLVPSRFETQIRPRLWAVGKLHGQPAGKRLGFSAACTISGTPSCPGSEKRRQRIPH
jgi:hypothetical protein